MRPSDELAHFVREALALGRTRPEINDALGTAGWSEKERADALSAYADTDFVPPVPRPRPYVSAKDVFLYGLLFVALGVTAVSLNNLIFALVNIWLPESGNYQSRAWQEDSIRIAVSTLIFSFPLFLWLNHITAKAIGKDAGKRRSAIRKILTYLTLFITALIVLTDLVTLVYYVLSGDTTLRFVLKVLSVGVISGAIFLYYLRDASADEKSENQ
jgi:hypothetical protein